MSIHRSRSKGSSGSHSKHIPTPPPLPPVRSAHISKSHTLKNKTQPFHSGATIAYDGAGRVVWLKDVETGKIYFNISLFNQHSLGDFLHDFVFAFQKRFLTTHRLTNHLDIDIIQTVRRIHTLRILFTPRV